MHAGFRGSFFEGVEIHDDHVDGLNAVLGNGCTVSGILAAMKNSAVNFRVERFNTSIEHFGEAGEVGDVFYFDSRVAQELGRAAGRDEFDAHA